MWNYIKYLLRMFLGMNIIIALDVILKKADPFVGDLWFYMTIILYFGYCFIDYYLLKEKED